MAAISEYLSYRTKLNTRLNVLRDKIQDITKEIRSLVKEDEIEAMKIPIPKDIPYEHDLSKYKCDVINPYTWERLGVEISICEMDDGESHSTKTGTDDGNKLVIKKLKKASHFRLEIENMRRVKSEYVVKLLFISDNFTFGMEYFGVTDFEKYLIEHDNTVDIFGKIIHKGSAIDQKFLTDVAERVAFGLKDIHQAGLVHCDLKPANIVIDESGNAKIIDLGVSELIGNMASQRPGDIFICDPQMMYEQRLPIEPKMDIWSLGMVIIMASSCPNYSGVSMKGREVVFRDSLMENFVDTEKIVPFLWDYCEKNGLMIHSLVRYTLEHMLIYERDKRDGIEEVIRNIHIL